MFERLTERFDDIFQKIKGQGIINEKNVDEAIREIRIALLEADVNYKIVKELLAKVKEKALGRKVVKSVSPGQAFVKIIHDEMVNIMGEGFSGLELEKNKPATIMLVGLQGSGKTTHAGKLAVYLKKKYHRPLLVAGDIYRPAAIEQLKTLGKSIDVPVYAGDTDMSPPEICREALKYAEQNSLDTVIIDTAGRLQIDEPLMEELNEIKKEVTLNEILFVADAMTGQEAVNIASTFHNKVGMDVVCLTKLDGDARGGAALSIKYVTGKPIKFAGTGEKLSDLEEFHPERMVSRILGMGDVVSLVEKAQESVDHKKAKELERKIKKQQFTLEDFLEQLHQVKKMGSLDKIFDMIPGSQRLKGNINMQDSAKELKKTEAIILSMTPLERKKPKILNGSRRKRIARGSGTRVQDVNKLIKNFNQMKKMMKMFKNPKKMARMKQMFPFK